MWAKVRGVMYVGSVRFAMRWQRREEKEKKKKSQSMHKYLAITSYSTVGTAHCAIVLWTIGQFLHACLAFLPRQPMMIE